MSGRTGCLGGNLGTCELVEAVMMTKGAQGDVGRVAGKKIHSWRCAPVLLL